ANTNLPQFVFTGVKTLVNSAVTTPATGSVTTLTNGSGNEVQSLTLSGTPGNVTLSLAGQVASGAVAYTPAFNEVEHLAFTGTSDPSTRVQLSFTTDGVNFTFGTTATELTYVTGVSPTADDVAAHLRTITGLHDDVNQVDNFAVTGNPGGPFDITFTNQLAATDVRQLVANDDTPPGGGPIIPAGAVITTTTSG